MPDEEKQPSDSQLGHLHEYGTGLYGRPPVARAFSDSGTVARSPRRPISLTSRRAVTSQAGHYAQVTASVCPMPSFDPAEMGSVEGRRTLALPPGRVWCSLERAAVCLLVRHQEDCSPSPCTQVGSSYPKT